MAPEMPTVTVGALLRTRTESPGLALELLAGASGMERPVTIPFTQKTGLALAGFEEYLHRGRVLVLGESEVRFLEQMDASERVAALERTCARDLPAILVTSGLEPPPDLVSVTDRAALPLLRTSVPTPWAIARLTALLEDLLAPREIIHGVLLDILGLGVLLLGESGIGKSECALHLVVRGHRLVADDTVEVRRRTESILMGTCPELTRHHMEIRGLGIINIEELFGVAATRSSKRVELVVQLERWEPGRRYERLGLDIEHATILGCAIPTLRMPVAPGRTLAILVEVAARNELLRARGRGAAVALAERHEEHLRQAARQKPPDPSRQEEPG